VAAAAPRGAAAAAASAKISHPGRFAMRIWRLTVGLLIAVWLIGGGPWPPAGIALAQGDLFTVHDISVDATAEDAASARVAALEDGHRQAMTALLIRLVPRDELLTLPEISAEQIAQLVGDFTVDQERTSDVRYLAKLTFRFNAESVRQFLGEWDLPFAQARGRPILVLPVLGTGGGARLWQDPNPWRDSWNARRLEGELIPMVLPFGDLDDVGAIDARQAVNGDGDRLQAVMRRYEVDEVLVAQLRLTGDPATGWATAEAVGRLYGGAAEQRSVVLTFNQEPEEDETGLFGRAVDGLVSEIQEAWKAENLLRFTERNRLMVTVPVASLAEWLEVKRRLDDIASVVGRELAYMTRRGVDLMITYVGSEDQLARALARKDLVLTQDRNQGWWRLTLNAALPQSDSEPGVE
jgi:hypothetical protein